jgi:hypothetical protein
VEVADQINGYFASATPFIQSKEGLNQTAFLLVPASDAGKTFGETAQKTLTDLQLVRVPGQAHLMFCREQGYLQMRDVQELLRPFRPTYERSAVVPISSSHARFDIVDWVPLDP